MICGQLSLILDSNGRILFLHIGVIYWAYVCWFIGNFNFEKNWVFFFRSLVIAHFVMAVYCMMTMWYFFYHFIWSWVFFKISYHACYLYVLLCKIIPVSSNVVLYSLICNHQMSTVCKRHRWSCSDHLKLLSMLPKKWKVFQSTQWIISSIVPKTQSAI